TNLQNTTDIGTASITMKVGADWVKAHGGADAVKIFRYDPDTGEKQILETNFRGYDAKGRAIFKGFSPGGLSIFALVALAAPPADIAPSAVISVSPTDGAIDVPVDTSISVSFSEPMDKASVGGAFSIKPEVSGKFGWGDNRLTLDPTNDLAYGTTYKVIVATGARDLAGNGLAADHTWSFTTRAAPTNWVPVGGIIGAIAVIAGLLIYFLVMRRRHRI
ncbi:MAG: hypothetical protein COS88_03045, partial [Chloroflexi bacterium CG07_land_8_20_14_0_80_51_10]